MNIDFIPSPNWSRRYQRVTAIVIHYTATMTMEGVIEWFRNPKSQVSAHYVVGRDGRIVQMVADPCVAWHAGRSRLGEETGVNSFSLGIELVGTDGSGFTDVQMAALWELLTYLVTRYRIRPDRVIGHADIAPGRKIDPDGSQHQFDWVRTRAVVLAAWQSIPPSASAYNV